MSIIKQFLKTSSDKLNEAVSEVCDKKQNIEEMSAAGAGSVSGTPMVIDLGARRRGELNESTLSMFGSQIEMMLSTMFGSGMLPSGMVRGTPNEVEAFAKLLGREKDYAAAYDRYGLTDPKTYGSKYALDRAIRGFERETGIKWPVK